MTDPKDTVNQPQHSTATPEGALTPAEQSIHNNFLQSVKALRRDLVRTAYYLVQVRDRNIHRQMGFTSVADYAAKTAGLTRRQTEEFLAIGRKLPQYQEVEEALAEGRLSWSKARLLVRRAEPDEQKRWIEVAQSVSVRQLEDVLPPKPPQDARNRPPGGGRNSQSSAQPKPDLFQPRDKPPMEPRAYFTFRLTQEQYAMATRLLEGIPGRDKEEKLLNTLSASGGQDASSVLPYLLVILHCPVCGRATIPTNRGEAPVSQALLEAAHCDAIIEDADGNRRRTVPPRLRRKALQRARFRCEAEGCGHAQFLQIHHRLPAAAGGGNTLENLVVLCSGCHRALHEKEAAARCALGHAP